MRHLFSPKYYNVFLADGFRVSRFSSLPSSETPEVYFRITRGTLSAVKRNSLKRLVRRKLNPYLQQFISHMVFHVGKNHRTSPWAEFIKGVNHDLERFLQTYISKTRKPATEASRALGA